jgi:hypothetical protein
MTLRKWNNPTGTPEYYAWRNMRDRCRNRANPSWPHYGARGITVCDRWAEDYDTFFADMGARPKGMTLDRIDTNLGYCPENCRWTDTVTQARNRRNNVFLSHGGETRTVSAWAADLGVKPATLHRRLKTYKLPLEQALTSASLVPVRRCGTRQGYVKGCRCVECKAAHAAACMASRHRREARLRGAAA